MTHHFPGITPMNLIKLTPSEFDALVGSTRKTVAAAEKASRGRT
jgi:hypothetical protein